MTNWVRQEGTEILHKDGVDWFEAKKPFFFHRCKPQTRGYTSTMSIIEVQRCACGAIKFTGDRFWSEKNSRKS